jgi:predicted RNA-binding protein YlxR (DUF448 family)
MTHTAPVRMCVGCGQRDAQRHFLRFSLGRDGELKTGSGNGRGGYLHPRRTCIVAFVNGRPGFVRSLRTTVPREIRARYLAQIERNATLL